MDFGTKFKDLILSILPGKKPWISEEQFRNCVFSFLLKQITDQELIQRELSEISSLLKINGIFDNSGKICGRLYLAIENHISEVQSKNRISKDSLREKIFKSCQADRAEGDFALIFLPAYLRRIRFFEKFTDSILEKLKVSTGESYFSLLNSFGSEGYLNRVIKSGRFDWPAFEKNLQNLLPEKQLETARVILNQVLNKCFRSLLETAGTIRAEFIFQETYRQFKERFNFLEDAPQVLLIVPEQILSEERIEIMPKTKLAGEVTKKTQELEIALSELSAEKQKLAAALESLQKVDRAKGDFINVVSHQFRTPLSAIRWNSELLSEEVPSLVQNEAERERFLGYAKVMQDKSIFLINILDDIYDVLYIEGGDVKIEKKPSQLWEIVNDILGEFKKEIERKKINLVFDKAKVPVKEIMLDQQKIKRVSAILIRGNGSDYHPGRRLPRNSGFCLRHSRYRHWNSKGGFAESFHQIFPGEKCRSGGCRWRRPRPLFGKKFYRSAWRICSS